ncbi:MAG: c-type cytochrome [Planctomycetes bacterium]|nr:c-type cytochrome [Planctomycetota bacterium]
MIPQARPRAFVRRLAVGFAARCALAVVAGCDGERPVLEHALAPETTALDEATGEPRLALAIQAKLRAELERLCGTPHAPRYALRTEWQASGFDPNRPFESVGELSASERDALRAENRDTFEDELEELDDANFDGARPSERYFEFVASFDALATAPDRVERARTLLVDRYPTLAESAESYRVKCSHCHGVSGGGDGRTGQFLEPKPRDFRHGVFKYTGQRERAVPRRADLLETLERGLQGTAMPSFRELPLGERHGLADYVRLLALRGMIERRLAAFADEEGELTSADADEVYAEVWEQWRRADEHALVLAAVPPEATPERVRRGRELFHDVARANCVQCHGESGRGDGPAVWTLDLDGERVLALHDDWGRPTEPRDLTRGRFRGGDRPIDLYRRIWAGIPGTPMPGIGGARGADGAPVFISDDVWCLVHYVRALAYGSADDV